MEQKNEVLEEGPIKPTDTIQSIFDRYPGSSMKLSQIMTNAGLHCVGCHASTFETLEEGLMGHGYDEEALMKLLGSLNAEVTKEEQKGTDISLSDVASKKVNEFLQKENKVGGGLRVALVEGGCSGYQYELSLREKPDENEVMVESKGVKLFLTKEHLDKMEKCEIDYIDGLQGAGFKVNNPNVVKSCGCGHSHGF